MHRLISKSVKPMDELDYKYYFKTQAPYLDYREIFFLDSSPVSGVFIDEIVYLVVIYSIRPKARSALTSINSFNVLGLRF